MPVTSPVNDTDAANDAAITAADAGAPDVAATAAGIAQLIRAWSTLLESEMAVARRSVIFLLLGAIALPVIGLGIWLGLNALLVAVAQIYTHSLLLSLLLVCGVQLGALALLLHQLRRWLRDLTLPQSRAALARAMEKMS